MINKKMDTSHHRATVMEVTAGLVGIPIFDIKIFAQDLEVYFQNDSMTYVIILILVSSSPIPKINRSTGYRWPEHGS